MTRTAMGGLFAGFISGAAVVFFGLSSQAGGRSATRRRFRDSKDRIGKPDLNGIWQAMNTANYDIQSHAARRRWRCARSRRTRAGQGGAGLRRRRRGARGLGVVEGDEIPYLPDALEKKQKNQENWLARDPEIKCYLPGVPRATYMPFPFQILQSDKAIFIAYEYAGAVRNIYLKDPGPPQVDSWMGQSVGPVGRRHVRRRRRPASTIRPGSIAPATSTASS